MLNIKKTRFIAYSIQPLRCHIIKVLTSPSNVIYFQTLISTFQEFLNFSGEKYTIFSANIIPFPSTGAMGV
jgi:hypothetical protein